MAAAPIVKTSFATLTPLSQSVFSVVAVPPPVAVVWLYAALAFDALVVVD